MRRLLLPALAVLFVLSGCGKHEPSRVIVLGIDGLDPQTVDLLMSEGKLPNFAKLRLDGAYAPLLSAEPLLSPVIWTTIATGKTPDEHRIGHFVAVNQETGEQLPVTSQMRKTKALWNVLSEKDRSVGVVGWWATWPAESVKGSVVSDHFAYHFLFQEGLHGDPNTEGKTYPPDLRTKLAPLVKKPGDITLDEASRYVKVSPEEWARPFDIQDDLSEFKWALSTLVTYKNVALKIWKDDKPDNLFLYVEGVDSTSHLFGHLFRAAPLSGDLAEQQKRYGSTVEQMYITADALLGDVMAAMDKKTTLIVLSDHGFQLGELPDDPSKLKNMRRVSEQFHRLHGVLYLYGHNVKKRARFDEPNILDIAPTVLALNGVPPAKDMPGRVLTEGLDIKAPARVPTYESGKTQTASGEIKRDSAVDPEVIKKLQSLGYLHATSPSGDRNIAAILFEQGKFSESAAMYAKLVKEKPDDSGLHASLAGALGALGRFDQAKAELDAALKIDPLNAEAYHNRAVINEREGNKAGAVADYQNALKVNPSYEPSRQALSRLGVTAQRAPQARTPEETQAMALADQASNSARRGDYKTAMQQLEEAQRIAPRLALIYQYKSNVAYLMGDKVTAIAALKKGLELDPGNLLFQENLKRLQRPEEPAAAQKR